MSWWSRLLLAARFVRREIVSGELSILALALLVAVTALTSVSFFSDRVARALTTQATQLLAADLVLSGNQPAPAAIRQEAQRRGLQVADNISFPSMVFAQGQATLATYKAVSNSYPLRGEVTVRRVDGQLQTGRLHPAAGMVWADARLLRKLGVKLGERINVGNIALQLDGEILREPDGAMDLYNFVPRLMFNSADLAATGLIQEGSRARWRLMLAGDDRQISDLRQWLAARLPAGSRLENVEEARPEIRTALERARRFLGLTAMLTVALSAAAVALAVRRYLARHWQPVAVLRCMGLTSSEVLGLFVCLFLLLGLLSGVLGTLAGFAVQLGLMQLSSRFVGEVLPNPGWQSWLLGPAASLLLLTGLALPPLLAIRQVSPLAVLRNDVPLLRSSLVAPLLAVLVLLLLAAWQMDDVVLAAWLLGGMLAFFAGVGLLAWGMLSLLRRLPAGRQVGWRYGVANLARRPWLAIVQIVALAVGIMALLTLTVVRDDLIAAWQKSVPADAPNKFVINIQQGQRAALQQQFVTAGLPAPALSPMIRGRLLAINDKPVRPSALQDEQARRLAEREFNLSWRDELPEGNRILSGQWWQAKARPQFSVEQGLARTLGIRLGDTLAFDIGGTTYRARVTSLRSVAWDSFRVNFFVLAPPSLLQQQPASWISSFRLDAAQEDFANRLVAAFPNISIIDVSAILDEVRAMVDKLTRAIEAMFVLALAAGVLVLWAALAATRDERLFDIALMRALGASDRQVRAVILAELAWLGAFTGLLAALGAMGVGGIAASKLFNLPWSINAGLLPLGMGCGMLVVMLAGWPLVGRVTRTSPLAVLRSV
ncbi:ABC transporter permease [Aquitalea sp. USM4]|uniref:ABC transporter permease n=1 Tax=Aquitalea sp. USM4 TaxID=1590041 RepID=UPI00103998BD|nr:FtsX-like permease family protein [Aquitalea sp. USM4]QBJ78585.1 oxidoreductase [Aquitalea sp. USM4]